MGKPTKLALVGIGTALLIAGCGELYSRYLEVQLSELRVSCLKMPLLKPKAGNSLSRYQVQAPDGTIITIEGPSGTAEKQALEQAKNLYHPASKDSAQVKILETNHSIWRILALQVPEKNALAFLDLPPATMINPDEIIWNAPGSSTPDCNPESLQAVSNLGPNGMQGRIVNTYERSIHSRVWSLIAATCIAVVLALPWFWYFLLRRVRELFAAISGK